MKLVTVLEAAVWLTPLIMYVLQGGDFDSSVNTARLQYLVGKMYRQEG